MACTAVEEGNEKGGGRGRKREKREEEGEEGEEEDEGERMDAGTGKDGWFEFEHGWHTFTRATIFASARILPGWTFFCQVKLNRPLSVHIKSNKIAINLRIFGHIYQIGIWGVLCQL